MFVWESTKQLPADLQFKISDAVYLLATHNIFMFQVFQVFLQYFTCTIKTL